MPPVTEIIYFQAKSSVKPEDPSNDEGASLLQLFQATTQQSGHIGSAWGRTKEDEKVLVWVIGQYSLFSVSLPFSDNVGVILIRVQ